MLTRANKECPEDHNWFTRRALDCLMEILEECRTPCMKKSWTEGCDFTLSPPERSKHICIFICIYYTDLLENKLQYCPCVLALLWTGDLSMPSIYGSLGYRKELSRQDNKYLFPWFGIVELKLKLKYCLWSALPSSNNTENKNSIIVILIYTLKLHHWHWLQLWHFDSFFVCLIVGLWVLNQKKTLVRATFSVFSNSSFCSFERCHITNAAI